MRKNILSLFAMIFILSAFSYNAYAATSDALAENGILHSSIEKEGSKYEAPFNQPEGEIDTTNGSVNTKVTDLSLPGKNGLDLNIYRFHNSYDSGVNFEFRESNRKHPAYLGVPYTYTYNGVTNTIYIGYEREEDIQETITANTESIIEPRYDDNNVRYRRYEEVRSGKNLKLTWDKTTAPKTLWLSKWRQFAYSGSNGSFSIGNAWYITIPYIKSRDCVSNNNSGKIFTREYMELATDDGLKQTLTYSYDYDPDADDGELYSLREIHVMNDNSRYTAEYTGDSITDDRGFTYNLTIKDLDGKTFYFYSQNFFSGTDAEIKAVGDRFGNVILYNKTTDGWRITDTYGRIVEISKNGIVVNAGGKIKRIDYSFETIIDRETNPYDYYKTFNTYKFIVKEYTGENRSGEVKKTEYCMKKKTMGMSDNYYEAAILLIPHITEIKYPTNAQKQYTYEDKPTMFQYVEGSQLLSTLYSYKSYCDYLLYRVTGEKSYENGELKADMSFMYNGNWYPAKDPVIKTYKTFVTTQTLENGHKSVNSKEYDSLGRLLTDKTEYKGEKSVILNTVTKEYSYGNGVGEPDSMSKKAIVNARRAPVTNTLTYYGVDVVSAVDTDYERDTGKPTLYKNGESAETYTYDNSYGLLLTKVTKRLSGGDIKEQNTLTMNNKAIGYSRIYENNVLKDTISYTYNPDGTKSSEKIQSMGGTGGIVTTNYTYTYNTDCSYTITSTTSGSKNADGVAESITTSVSIDSFGRKTAETDGNGNTTRYEYDMLGQVTKQINPDRTEQSIAYDISNNKLSVTDENGNLTTRSFTPMGKLKKIYLDNDVSKTIAEYTYDKLDRPTSEISYMEIGGTAVKREYTYDDLGRVITKTDKENDTVLDTETSSYSYSFNNSVTVCPSNSIKNVTVTGYKKAFVIFTDMSKSASYADGELKVYLDNKEIKSGKFRNNKKLTAVFNLTGGTELKFSALHGAYSAKVILLPDDSEQELVNAATSIVTKSYVGDADFVKPTTVTETDGYGNVISESFYKGAVSDTNLLNKNMYWYDLQNNVIKTRGGRTYMENLGEYTTMTEYDYLNKPIKSYRADGTYTTAEYDKQGNITSSTDYMGNKTIYTYDGLGREVKRTVPFEDNTDTKSLTYYDKNGNVVMTKQQNNKPGEAESYTITENEYDCRNRLITVKVNDGTRNIYTQYAYDSVGNITKCVTGQTEKLTDLNTALPEGASVVSYEYDRFGNVTKTTDALGKSETSTYNLAGLPETKTDRNGNTAYYTYNAYGSVKRLYDSADTMYCMWNYSANNLLLSCGDREEFSISPIFYAYDEMGNVVRERNGSNKQVKTYTYDADGNRKTYTLTQNGAVTQNATYTYDNINRLINVSYNNGISASYTYDANDRLIKEITPDNTAEYSYNKAGLLTALGNSSGADYSYSYRLDGNRTEKTDSLNGDTAYTYDGLGQLKSETQTKDGINTSTSYEYDSRGNRINMTNGGIISSYTYDANNRLLHTTVADNGSQTDTSYTYDDNGNLICKQSGNPTNAEGASAELELSVIGSGAAENTDGAMSVSYSYDGLNRLKTVQTETGLNVSYAYDVQGRRIKKTVNGEVTLHVWDGSNIVSDADENRNAKSSYYRGIKLIAGRSGTSTAQYYVYDGHGNVTGYAGENYSYDAFGNLQTDNENINPFLYCGEYTDAETGMIYLRNRYYDPTTGRFITEDIAHDGLNWYVYCRNNPIMLIDPNGLKSYVFYGSDQIKNKEPIEKALYEINPDSPVQSFYISSPEDFYNAWNSMGFEDGKEVDIDTVVINIHGTINNNVGSMVPNLGTLSQKPIDMSKLDAKSMDVLTLLSCNTGLIDSNNVAKQFLKGNRINYLIAPDGFVSEKRGIGLYNSAINADKSYPNYKNRLGNGFCLYRKYAENIMLDLSLIPDNIDTSLQNLIGTAKYTAFKNTFLYNIIGQNYPNVTADDIKKALLKNPNNKGAFIKDINKLR